MFAASARDINTKVNEALRLLYSTQPTARDLAKRARAILVFPNIIKAGLIIGGQSGNGALRIGGATVGYLQHFSGLVWPAGRGAEISYALFFMNDAALRYLQNSGGWAIGQAPVWSSLIREPRPA